MLLSIKRTTKKKKNRITLNQKGMDNENGMIIRRKEKGEEKGGKGKDNTCFRWEQKWYNTWTFNNIHFLLM